MSLPILVVEDDAAIAELGVFGVENPEHLTLALTGDVAKGYSGRLVIGLEAGEVRREI